MKRRNLWDIAAGVFGLAVVYLLVRPHSKAADLVTGFGNAMTAIVTHAADLAT
jgi:hypothetical protein